MIRTSVITSGDRLRALRPDWEALLEASVTNELTLHPAWVLPWWEVFGVQADRGLRTLAFHDGDRLVGLAPLLGRRHVYPPRIPFRRLELLASGEDEADETCSDYLGPIAERGREADVAEALAGALARGEAGGWDEISLSAMNGDSPLPALLRAALEARGFHVSVDDSVHSAYVTLPKTWDAYVAMLRRKKRWQLRQVLKSFEAWAGEPPRIHYVRSHADLAEGKRVLVALHSKRWGEAGGGVFASPRFTSFHDRVMPALLDHGALDLGWLAARGEPVAAFYNFRWKGKVSHYQAGRSLDVPHGIRVGVVMNACLIRSAIEDGMREYDFLAGEAPYKRALAPGARPLVSMRAARPSMLETARRAAARAIVTLRALRDRARRDRDRDPDPPTPDGPPAPEPPISTR